MIRRNARLRKEYLYRKSLEGKEKATYERKRLVRKALDGEYYGHLLGLVHTLTAALGCLLHSSASSQTLFTCSRQHWLAFCMLLHSLL
jgi:hypothetical protein